jgi:hypothetical protein
MALPSLVMALGHRWYRCRRGAGRVRYASAIVALLVAAFTAAGPAGAADPEPPSAADEFLLGNTLFVLAHEFGHVIIHDFDVPILGLEEPSADTLATGLLILAGQRPEAVGDLWRFADLLAMAAVGNVFTWRGGLELQSPELLYWAQHDVSARRAARILCLLVGSDPARFGWLADAGLVPEVRAEACPDEYAMAARAVRWVGQTYGRFRDGKAVDESREITIRYFEPANPAQAALRDRLQAARVIETVVDFYDRAFRFREPLEVRLASCGVPNGYWDPGERRLKLCYELLENLDRQSRDPEVARAYAALRGRATMGQPDTPAEPQE